MGIFFSSLWGQLFGNKEHKVIIVGLNNAGKTTILYKLVLNQVVETVPTIGSNVEQVKFRNITMAMWDLGGQEAARTAWTTYYQNAQAVILVIDSSDKNRLNIIKAEFLNMLRNELLLNAVFLIFANKQDVRGCLTPAEISDALSLHTIRDHEWHIQPCCALTGQGLQEGLEWIVQKIKQ
eukprot:TRINITY_DN27_c1_g1_i1.p1 TRINITY_DN27_c1_g1~~TRINITY_DN27_c1_g1_i1.p1  ORF type:complete len:180 (+),score=65.45 TRINITY_DN27_c1_g1_i1:70-609(+)